MDSLIKYIISILLCIYETGLAGRLAGSGTTKQEKSYDGSTNCRHTNIIIPLTAPDEVSIILLTTDELNVMLVYCIMGREECTGFGSIVGLKPGG